MKLKHLAVAACAAGVDQPGNTAFCGLSEAAKDLIIRAVLGEFDKAPPADVPQSVKDEIAAWAASDD